MCRSTSANTLANTSAAIVALTLPLSIAIGLAACNTRSVDCAPKEPVKIVKPTFVQSLDKEVDILFVIDNSQSMLEEQRKLGEQFEALIEALRLESEGGRLPDVHIGVVTTTCSLHSISVRTCSSWASNGLCRS